MLEAGQLVHGLVIDAKPDHAQVRVGELTARVAPADFAWTGKKLANEIFAPGDVDLFQVKEVKGAALHLTLDQRPQVQGALVALDNSSGAILALVGGYDFEESKFNRAVQAERQSGSSFKIYVYAQALLDGANPFDTIVDAPLSYPTSSGLWSPHNYDNKYEGTITLLHALAESRNIPAVRLLARVGVDKVIKLCRKFGLTSRLVPNLPLALGASDLTLLEHTSAFTTFPEDGVHIAPRMIERVVNYDGRIIDDFPPEVADALPAPIARLETSMLREVFMSGTATRAKALAEKYPLAGKTGTTSDFVDAWFLGFSPKITCGVWVGFDDHRSLGNKEEGAKAALPIWMEFMEQALKDRPVEDFAHSPLLKNPDQVKEILARAGEGLLATAAPGTPASGEGAGGAPPPAAPAQKQAPPGASTPAVGAGATNAAGAGTAPKPTANPLPAKAPAIPPNKEAAVPPAPKPAATVLNETKPPASTQAANPNARSAQR
ncbi:MAG: hypothetical protein LAN62_18915 [Acidobacteriia bacterium]|nr:hypothetical protein [Terriglobia bacterium]